MRIDVVQLLESSGGDPSFTEPSVHAGIKREVSSGYVAEMAWWSDQVNTTANATMSTSRWIVRNAAPVVLANIGCPGTTLCTETSQSEANSKLVTRTAAQLNSSGLG